MGEPTTMTVEQGKCEIYPATQSQLCMRVRVTVVALTPSPDVKADWIADDAAPIRLVQLRCSQRGLERLLQKLDDGTTAPKKRGAKPDVPEA